MNPNGKSFMEKVKELGKIAMCCACIFALGSLVVTFAFVAAYYKLPKEVLT